MYSACIFCHASLGTNEVIECFPVGRRLAFDAAKGRLWVVCGRCRRWNLTPLEERWEAIDECERRFRATRLRTSTDNVGLCRLQEGLELVRIGRPLRPELAAWRYGERLWRRRVRAVAATAVGTGAVGGAMLFGAAAVTITGLGLVGMGASLLVSALMRRLGETEFPKVVTVLPRAGDEPLMLTQGQLWRTRVQPAAGGWALEIADDVEGGEPTRLLGGDAVRAAALLLPVTNPYGASGAAVRAAVRLLEGAGDPDALFRCVAAESDETISGYRDGPDGRILFNPVAHGGVLPRLPPLHRLALEIAAHDEAERRAMAGELALLEEAWRAAEEIAAIADELALPGQVEAEMRRLKGE